MGIELVQNQNQTLTLSAQQLMGLRLLAKSLPDLRTEIVSEMNRNPAIEDIEQTLEKPLSELERKAKDDEREPDYPEDDFVPETRRYDEEALERRQAFFDNQVKSETLQEHLLAQLPLSDIPREDWPMVEVLVGDLNDNGFYRGSIPDVMMAFGKSEKEVVSTLAKISEFDPPGCGARNARECLLAQMDALEDSPYEDDVRKMIEDHLEDIGSGRFSTVMRELGLTKEQYAAALKELRTLNPHPGRGFPGERDRVEYVNPEIHTVRASDGTWQAVMDARSLPEIRISKRFEAMLADKNQTPEVKAYVRERIAAAQALKESVRKRLDTVQGIADEIYARQQDFFERGFAALKPMTELEIAAKLGINGTTVSRTVRDKYAQTPQGTVELRRFFTYAVKTSDGTELSQEAALEALKRIVAAEDPASPLNDTQLAEAMKKAGYPVARRTVAKYRDKAGIPAKRGKKAEIAI